MGGGGGGGGVAASHPKGFVTAPQATNQYFSLGQFLCYYIVGAIHRICLLQEKSI